MIIALCLANDLFFLLFLAKTRGRARNETRPRWQDSTPPPRASATPSEHDEPPDERDNPERARKAPRRPTRAPDAHEIRTSRRRTPASARSEAIAPASTPPTASTPVWDTRTSDSPRALTERPSRACRGREPVAGPCTATATTSSDQRRPRGRQAPAPSPPTRSDG